MSVRKALIPAAFVTLALVAPTQVVAKGCIRGAVAGGVAGHYAGRHGFAGAAAGCLAGRAYYRHKAKVAAQRQSAQLPAHR